MESAYRRNYPKSMIRTLRPMSVLLAPFLVLVGVLDLVTVGETLVTWPSAFLLAFVIAALYGVAHFFGQFLESALVVTLLVFELVLLRHVSTGDDFILYFPGILVIVMLTPFTGIRFVHGQVATATIIGILAVDLWRKGIDMTLLVQGLVFLVPGVLITTAGGHAIDRQRRRLFAQVRILEETRSEHEQMALHDALTDLPNRRLLQERMEQSLARAKRHNGQIAVLFVDLDDFKTVNDRYGHAIGDQVLVRLAANLKRHVREEDTVARIGGDEFVVLSERVQDEQGARIAADRVQQAIAEPIVVDASARDERIDIHVTCSIGIALCPRDGESLEQLVSRADQAMYTAKRDGKSTARFFDHAGISSSS